MEASVLTDQEIENAKKRTKYSLKSGPHHENKDCIRIAYEWLDAQSKTKHITKTNHSLKHIIENWAGRYVSRTDVDVAAELHPGTKGTYPYFNISSRMVHISKLRLDGINEAFTHFYKEGISGDGYVRDE
jgi:hypothetical protein